MAHRFDQRLVRVQQFHVLADHRDGDFVLWIELGVDHFVPLGQVGAVAFQAKALNHEIIQTLSVQHARDLVDGVGVFQRNHGALFNVGEQRDLATRGHINVVIGTADQDVWLQADGTQLFNRVLCRFGFRFASGGDVRNQSQVHQHGALGAHFDAQLTDSFEERLRLNVTHSAANLNHRYVGIAGALDDSTFDFVGDVRNHLDGCTQVITTALLAQDVFVNTARGEVVVLGHGRADKPLVMAQVQVGFGAVVCDEHFTVLERAHGARINVDVGVQLQHGDLKSPRLQDGCQ